jgi:site-specific recombinase XerD
VKVQRALDSATGQQRWLVIGPDYLPVESICAFLFYLENIGKSPNTCRAYAHHLKLYWEYLAERDRAWTTVGLQELAEFVGWLRTPVVAGAPARADNTVNVIVAAVTSFYDFHWRNEQIRDIPLYRYLSASQRQYKPFLHHVSKGKPALAHLLKRKPRRTQPQVLSREQVAQALAACGNLRDRLLVSLLYETGMRIGAALGLRHADICSWELTVRIVPRQENADWARTKGINAYPLQVTAEWVQLYADYLVREFRDCGSDYVFVNLWQEPRGQALTYAAVADLFRRLSRKVGFKVHPHMFRHTHGTELVQHGLDVVMVQQRLGHQQVQTTRKYLHLSANEVNAAIRAFQGQQKGGKP